MKELTREDYRILANIFLDVQRRKRDRLAREAAEREAERMEIVRAKIKRQTS